jgi:putative phage-type endonuclease
MQSSAERVAWLEARKKGIGASDAPAILGLSPWKKPADIWETKRPEYQHPEPGPAQLRGLILEDAVGRAACLDLNLNLRKGVHVTHPDIPWMMATPDFIADNGALIQVKTHAIWVKDDYDNEAVPEHEWVQVQHEMAVTGADYCFLAVLLASEDALKILADMVSHGLGIEPAADLIRRNFPVIYRRVERNPSFVESLIEAERVFWEQHVQAGVCPPDYRTAKDSGKVRQATEKEAKLIAKAKTLWQRMKKAEERLEGVKSQIEEAIGPDNGIECPEGKITWTTSKASSKTVTNWMAIAAELAEAFRVELVDYVDKFTTCEVKAGTRAFRWPTKKWSSDE